MYYRRSFVLNESKFWYIRLVVGGRTCWSGVVTRPLRTEHCVGVVREASDSETIDVRVCGRDWQFRRADVDRAGTDV
jgi:hypothetical protein